VEYLTFLYPWKKGNRQTCLYLSIYYIYLFIFIGKELETLSLMG